MPRVQITTGKFSRMSDAGEPEMFVKGDEVEVTDYEAAYMARKGMVAAPGTVSAPAPAADSGDDEKPASLDSLELPPAVVEAFESRGLTLNEIAAMSDDDLLEIDGVGPATVKKIRAAQA